MPNSLHQRDDQMGQEDRQNLSRIGIGKEMVYIQLIRYFLSDMLENENKPGANFSKFHLVDMRNILLGLCLLTIVSRATLKILLTGEILSEGQ